MERIVGLEWKDFAICGDRRHADGSLDAAAQTAAAFRCEIVVRTIYAL